MARHKTTASWPSANLRDKSSPSTPSTEIQRCRSKSSSRFRLRPSVVRKHASRENRLAQTSAAQSESEPSVAASPYYCRNSTKGKHEKNSIEYCFGVCGAVCVGTDLRDYHHNDHDRRHRDDYRVHSGQHDCA